MAVGSVREAGRGLYSAGPVGEGPRRFIYFLFWGTQTCRLGVGVVETQGRGGGVNWV